MHRCFRSALDDVPLRDGFRTGRVERDYRNQA